MQKTVAYGHQTFKSDKIRIRIRLDPWIRIRIETNADPKHWFKV
jgi:hypothetical protein